jgi:hypothetical protein
MRERRKMGRKGKRKGTQERELKEKAKEEENGHKSVCAV